MTFAPGLGRLRALIVNADDYGLSPGVNQGVLAAHRLGLVTSATLMANLPAAVAAVAAAPPTLALGLHLNLTTGEPCAGAARVPSLVDASGHFLRLRSPAAGVEPAAGTAGGPGARDRGATRTGGGARCRAGSPRRPSPHSPPPARPPDRAAAGGGHGIGAVRSPIEAAPATGGEAPRDRARRLAIGAAARRFQREAGAAGLRTSDHFRGLALGLAFDTAALVAVVERLPAGRYRADGAPRVPGCGAAGPDQLCGRRGARTGGADSPQLAAVRAGGVMLDKLSGRAPGRRNLKVVGADRPGHRQSGGGGRLAHGGTFHSVAQAPNTGAVRYRAGIAKLIALLVC